MSRPARTRGIAARAALVPVLAGAIAATAASPAGAEDPVDAVRREMQQMRKEYEASLRKLQQGYEARLQTLEQRLAKAEGAAQSAEAKADDAGQRAASAAAAPPPAPAPAPSAPASASAFNPAIGAVLDGKFGAYQRNPNTYRLPGFALGDEAKPPPRGFSVGETEVNLSANVDQALYANATISFARDNSVSVEEAFIQTTSLPGGLTLKAGRFFSGIGYLNEQHSHVWDFADAPLPYRAFLGNQYGDDGLQMRWLAPLPLFLELGAEGFRGDAFPAGGEDGHNAGVGAWSAFAHLGDDIGDSASWRVGGAQLSTKARNRTTTGLAGTDTYTGTDRTWVLDGVLKWAPHGNFAESFVKLQGEYLLRDQNGLFNGQPTKGLSTGWYLQSVWQPMPQWRFALRYDTVRANGPVDALAGSTVDPAGAVPRRYSVAGDYSTSEFGRFRLQYNLDKSRPQTDHQAILQYTISLGSHGAHSY